MSQPTIRHVAERAGVSKSLVSLVMRGSSKVSDERRRLVLAAAEEIGYRPNAAARSLVRQESHHLGLMVSDLRNPFFAEVTEGIVAAANAQGYRVLINSGFLSPARETEALETLLELRMDGILMAGARVASRVIRHVAASVPVVAITRSVRLPGVDVVVNDDHMGAGLAVDHLVELGHRRIAHIDGGSGSGANRRARGYVATMERHGLASHVRQVRADFTEEAGEAGVAQLLADGPRPTAIFCANDYQAVGVLDALREAGLDVPRDVSVVGYDNVHLASLRRLDLTTIHQPRQEMGEQAARLLLERLTTDRESRRVIIPPKLVVRGTTGPPPR
ncbi:LacI family DNA-binding transcriptional regulator [Nitriliruptor alkaliphilus]|uniref:LacI family DNA-binding transcriptional regulator n=1 Tax=Nitriliruptor alkaliphilus TaxID=427918 RepID=UPI000695ED9E|nr:LacI family DNA-binding transcriptional regulator [Nitriliruptor alkaliphilus]